MKALEHQRAAEPFNLNREVSVLPVPRPSVLQLVQAHVPAQPDASTISRLGGLQSLGQEPPRAST